MTVPKYVDFKCFQIKNNIWSLRLTGINTKKLMFPLTLSWRRSLSYRNQSSANQWTGFYMITASLMKELKITETVAQRCSVKKVFPEISQISQENTCPKISFLIKLQASGCICTIWILKNFWERLLLQDTSGGCFSNHYFLVFLKALWQIWDILQGVSSLWV